jgi:hypothetical protein
LLISAVFSFQSLKGRGFQMEDTRLTHPDRLCRLLGLLALAFAWCFLTGQWLHKQRATKIKKHGSKAMSLLKRGLKRLSRVLLPLSGHCDRIEFQQVLAGCFQGYGFSAVVETEATPRWLPISRQQAPTHSRFQYDCQQKSVSTVY